MKRKVIKQANQAFTITLPINWARENRINKDSEVDVEISGKSLIINSKASHQGKSTKIDLNGLKDKEIYRNIVALYAQGVDEIKITVNRDVSSTITKCLNSLIGYALVLQEDDLYVIKDINQGNYSNLDEIFKRIFQMILIFYDAAIKDVFGNEKETSESLRARDNEVNKFCLYLQRAINKISYDDQVKARTIFTYSFELEKISDEIERFWRANIGQNIKKTEEMKKLVELSKEALGKAFDLYFQFNNKKINEIYELRNSLREKSDKIKKTDAITTRFIRHMVKISEEAADLTHLTLIKNL